MLGSRFKEMGKEFLEKIRKLNWVLSESTTGKLSYAELSKMLSEVINTNFYVIDRVYGGFGQIDFRG